MPKFKYVNMSQIFLWVKIRMNFRKKMSRQEILYFRHANVRIFLPKGGKSNYEKMKWSLTRRERFLAKIDIAGSTRRNLLDIPGIEFQWRNGNVIGLWWHQLLLVAWFDFCRCSIIHLVSRLVLERIFAYLFVFVFVHIQFVILLSVCIVNAKSGGK